MSTYLDRLPQEEQDRVARMKQYLKLLRMSLRMTLREMASAAGVTLPTIANAENGTGAFTVKTYWGINRATLKAMDPRNTKTCPWSRTNVNTAVAAYIYEILIRNPDGYNQRVRDRCEYYANLFVPALYNGTVSVEDINMEWFKHFTDFYGVYLGDWSFNVYGDYWRN